VNESSTTNLIESDAEFFADTIHALIVRTPVHGRLRCVVLAYHVERVGEYVEPTLGLGVESETQVPEKIARWKEAYWNPAEFALFDVPELQIPELRERGTALAARVAVADDEFWRGFYVSVARRLNGRTWPMPMGVSDDFVVVATDLELVDLPRNFRGGVSSTLRELLDERGKLPVGAR
jgi:hypothetical protein